MTKFTLTNHNIAMACREMEIFLGRSCGEKRDVEIPAQAIAIAVAINVILDFIATAVDLFCLEAELTELAGELKMLDVDKLRKTRMDSA